MKNFFLYLFVIFSFTLTAQKNIELEVRLLDVKNLPKKVKPKTHFSSSEKLEIYLFSFLKELYKKGYIEASIDSLVSENDKKRAYLFLGKQYQLAKLENGNLQEEVTRKVKFKESNFLNQTFSFPEIEKVQKEVLAYYENSGYPFAAVYLDSFSISENEVSVKIYAEPHQVFTIDTIIVGGNSKTKSKYLQNYLGIKKDDIYDKSKIDKISQKLAQLRFVSEMQKAEVLFKNGTASLYIYLEKQKSNQFDFLLGIAPNSSFTKNKVNITGDGKLHLFNSFGVGEELYLNFTQLKPRTQNLDLNLKYPFLINLPFGVEAAFSLFKNDTAFLNLNAKAGVHYLFNGADYVQLYYKNNTSNVLNYDTAKVRREQKLPEVLDIRNNQFGFAFHLQNLDYVLNPRKGYLLQLGAGFGLKKIKENAKLKDINSEIYNQTATNSVNYTIDFNVQYHIPILKRHSFMLENKSQFFLSKNVLENEKYRIGGAKTLRGFDEEVIFTPFYSLFSLEYHFLLSKNTYFYAFGDLALVEDIRFGSGSLDTPYGFGVGAALETKGGIFSISYALGSQLDNKLEWRNGKIHFGYINIF